MSPKSLFGTLLSLSWLYTLYLVTFTVSTFLVRARSRLRCGHVPLFRSPDFGRDRHQQDRELLVLSSSSSSSPRSPASTKRLFRATTSRKRWCQVAQKGSIFPFPALQRCRFAKKLDGAFEILSVVDRFRWSCCDTYRRWRERWQTFDRQLLG